MSAVLQGCISPVSCDASVCSAKARFTREDLQAVDLDLTEVSEGMRGQAFTLGTALPWFQIISESAANALNEM
ncbi:hypothetical protein [Aquitalea palustris]|uniref:hypothetical protein n=1 Tax=Aquitalea palustris TaxID=2480983 RepID=UPI001CF03BC6|nr:hypothetical protein [Aquitalea palustris]